MRKLEEQEMSIKFNRKLGGERLFLVLVVVGWLQEGARSRNRFIFQFFPVVSPANSGSTYHLTYASS
jgi:hypothetical protein